jgi:hypothetical protein
MILNTKLERLGKQQLPKNVTRNQMAFIVVCDLHTISRDIALANFAMKSCLLG